MTIVSAYYSNQLAPIYLWMVGGADCAFAFAETEFTALNLPAAALCQPTHHLAEELSTHP
jgi:hypothetical protein